MAWWIHLYFNFIHSIRLHKSFLIPLDGASFSSSGISSGRSGFVRLMSWYVRPGNFLMIPDRGRLVSSVIRRATQSWKIRWREGQEQVPHEQVPHVLHIFFSNLTLNHPQDNFLQYYRDLLAIETVATINAALCDFHVRHCPPHKQILDECTIVRQRWYSYLKGTSIWNLTCALCLNFCMLTCKKMNNTFSRTPLYFMQALQIYTETAAEARRIESDLIKCRDFDVSKYQLTFMCMLGYPPRTPP